MGNTPICTIDATGIHKPAFADVLTYMQGVFTSVFGSDLYLGNDSQDGQFVGLLASAVDDCNSMCVQAYNSRGPSTAQGTGLSSIVKINGLTRLVPSYSETPVAIVGQFGTVINDGLLTDGNNVSWSLPAVIDIPASGTITVTATCSVLGAVPLAGGTVMTIATPTAGWQTATTTAAASLGDPLETDAQLRRRQAQSTMIPSLTILDGLLGDIAMVPGVTRYRGYENDTNTPDANGQPGHTVYVVVEGGAVQDIVNVIGAQKAFGGTYGSVQGTYTDANGIPWLINFDYATQAVIAYNITLHAYAGFTTVVQNEIAQAMCDWTNSLGIGAPPWYAILLNKANIPANLAGCPLTEGEGGYLSFTPAPGEANTYEIQSIQASKNGGPMSTADVPILFNEDPNCILANVNFTFV